jgi:acyl carrier protein
LNDRHLSEAETQTLAMDSLDLVELGTAIGEEFPGWAFTDEEYAGIDGSLTVGEYESIAKIHEPTECGDVWLRLRQVVARSHGVSAESILSGTRLIRF